MLTIKQIMINKQIDEKFDSFPFPSGVKTLFTVEEMETNMKFVKDLKKMLKDVNSARFAGKEKIGIEQFKEYYRAFLLDYLGGTIVDRLRKETSLSGGYDKDRMDSLADNIEEEMLNNKEKVKNLREKFNNILTKKTKR